MANFSIFDAIFEFLGDSPAMPLLKDQVMVYLAILKAFLIDHREGLVDETDSLLKLESLFSSFDLKNMNKFKAIEFCVEIYEITKKLMKWPSTHQSAAAERSKPSRSHYPQTSPVVFIDHLVEILEEISKETATSNRPLNYLILRIQRQLQFFSPHMKEITSDSPQYLKDIVTKITNLAYEVEYIVDLFLIGDSSCWLCVLFLFHMLEGFYSIQLEKKDGQDDYEDLEAKKTMINDMLVGGEEQLDLISISGRNGIGKTTFVKELYDSPCVIDHFEIRAWCNFYLLIDEGTILLTLLRQVTNLSDFSQWKNKELRKLLLDSLNGRRFFFVFDNFNKIIDWHVLKRCVPIPDSQNGSRIIIITTWLDFAFPAMKIVNPLPPRHAKIWDIIRDAIFPKETCPPQLLQVGIKIAKRCKFDSITSVVAHLKTIEKRVIRWEEVAQTLGSYLLGEASSQITCILELIYMYLPYHLRSCILYLNLYPRYEFSVSEFIRLWIAEGFIRHNAFKSLEDTAEDYFADLMARNLLISSEEKSIGGTKIFMINQQAGMFLLRKIREDNFSEFTSIDTLESKHTIYQQHRLCIRIALDGFRMSKPSGPFVQSLLFCSSSPSGPQDISFILRTFKFLRILNFANVNIGDSLKEFEVLVLLKYFAVRCSVEFIPPSISNLWNLETFVLKILHSNVVKVPDSIWYMTKLKHVNISHNKKYLPIEVVSIDLKPNRLEKDGVSILDNLQTFSTPSIAYGDDMETILRKVKGLRKLKAIFLCSWDASTYCNRFPDLGYLSQLISMNVSYKGEWKYPCQFNLPSNLKKLTLSNFRMPWFEISQLAMLSNLEVLKLVVRSVIGKRWEMEDDVVFPKLKYLELRGIQTVVEWSATSDNFPHLEQLILNYCIKLVQIPRGFSYINSLRRIKVTGCKPSTEISAQLIKEEHMKRGGESELVIQVKDNDHV